MYPVCDSRLAARQAVRLCERAIYMTSPTDHPPMYDFYEEFYRATLTSAAHAELCERAYGRNLAQHGFADMAQLEALIRVARLNSTTRALDIGCGSGHITEYLSDTTGAHFTGIDYSPTAIAQAQARTHEKADRLTFLTCDMSALPFPAHSFRCHHRNRHPVLRRPRRDTDTIPPPAHAGRAGAGLLHPRRRPGASHRDLSA